MQIKRSKYTILALINHLPDFRRASWGNGIEERFNYIHLSLRSAIERTFGVWKNRLRILRQTSSYDIKDQMLIVVATTILHNFIREKIQFSLSPHFLRMALQTTKACTLSPQTTKTFEKCSFLQNIPIIPYHMSFFN